MTEAVQDLEQRTEERTVEPVFTKIPRFGRKRIFGTETEYGVVNRWASFQGHFTSNGGLIYLDTGDHIEYASPECSNPVEAVIHSKAGERIASETAEKLYKHNRSSNSVTFGTHENYFTSADLGDLTDIFPFLVTRQIFAGSGYFHGDESQIAQRSQFMRYSKGNKTTGDRCILCTKDENLASVENWHRLHLILGDANMCEIAEFLKLGTTGLVLDLLEDRLNPSLSYDWNRYAVEDIRSIASQTSDWKLDGLGKATDAQRAYLDAAKSAYQGRDEITDALLDYWGFVLDELDNDPMSLVGIVDWITKKALIDQAKAQGASQDTLDNINLQYHDTNPKGLFYTMQKQGNIARLVSDEMIEYAVNNPPEDTRAYHRGRMRSKGRVVNWDAVSNKKMVDPFKFGKFCPERIRSLNGDMTAEERDIKQLLTKATDQMLADEFWRVVHEATGVPIPEKADYIPTLIASPDSFVFTYDRLISPPDGKLMLARNLGPRRGNSEDKYYYGGTIDNVPLGQEVEIKRKEVSEKWQVYVTDSNGSRNTWWVHPDELERKTLNTPFMAGYNAAKCKRRFFNEFVLEAREQLRQQYESRESFDTDKIFDLVSHDREAWQAYRQAKGNTLAITPNVLKRVQEALIPYGLEVE